MNPEVEAHRSIQIGEPSEFGLRMKALAPGRSPILFGARRVVDIHSL
jgi:hypothetical protein